MVPTYKDEQFPEVPENGYLGSSFLHRREKHKLLFVSIKNYEMTRNPIRKSVENQIYRTKHPVSGIFESVYPDFHFLR